MTTNEDIEDYMSDTFVTQGVNDIRPSLLHNHRSKVIHESMKKKMRSNPKPKSYYNELEKKLRDEALNKPLDYSNKGFELLEKMRLKAISTQHKSDEKTLKIESNISEPIKIELKNDRKGLGSEKVVNNKKQKLNVNQFDYKISEENFLNHRKSKNQMLLIEKDLKTCQKVCQTLDIESGIDENEFRRQSLRPQWFWPSISVENQSEEAVNEEQSCDDSEDDESEISLEQKLEIINDYLRNKYFYCIWCGIKFNDIQDLNDNCLGDNRDKHQ